MSKDILRKVGMEKEVCRVKRGLCPTCGIEIDENSFKDELSLREFRISGMCQKCQDSVFDGGD
jgi:hypothetical protein